DRTRPTRQRQIPLATRAPSIHGTQRSSTIVQRRATLRAHVRGLNPSPGVSVHQALGLQYQIAPTSNPDEASRQGAKEANIKSGLSQHKSGETQECHADSNEEIAKDAHRLSARYWCHVGRGHLPLDLAPQ